VLLDVTLASSISGRGPKWRTRRLPDNAPPGSTVIPAEITRSSDPGIVSPAARLIEPAIALSIVFVGADNLVCGHGRDARAWIALVFGLVHGFGFANVLREFGLPREALGWSLFSFNVGVEIGQLAIVLVVATLLAAIRRRSDAVSYRVAYAGSVVVIAAGSYWFVERVFFAV
jgi:hypothetical protein